MKLYRCVIGFYCLHSNSSIYSFEKRKDHVRKTHTGTLDTIAFNDLELGALSSRHDIVLINCQVPSTVYRVFPAGGIHQYDVSVEHNLSPLMA